MVLPVNINLIESSAPRWIIFLLDVFLSVFAIIFAFLLRYNFQIPDAQDSTMLLSIMLVTSVRGVSFIVTKLYAGIIRYTTFRDTERIFMVLLIGSLIIFVLNLFSKGMVGTSYLLPISVIVVDFVLVTLLLTATRILAKGIYWKLVATEEGHQQVLIFGAEQGAVTVKQTLERDLGGASNIIGFLTDNKKRIGNKIDGVRVYHYSDFAELATTNDVSTLLFADEKIDIELKRELVEKSLALDIKSLTVPKAEHWINGELSYKQMRKIRIEDLLERDAIKLDEGNIQKQVTGKRIIVTGAAGSIGSEIVRQLTRFTPAKIILIDQAETPLYDIQLELEDEFEFKNFKVIICDVSREDRMRRIFMEEKPEVVYHAAAYKHVPMMEYHPLEAVHNNIFGTKVVADLSHEFGVSHFVMVSTDKAVNPTNVMGASKRIAEVYIQSLNKESNTRFITTRFGNVLGSNGSVIPRFRKQIEQGGPITVTHPEITRYFMTIPEACQLVLEAGSMGKGGEIFIFDMGESVRIADLAKKMVKLSGLKLDKDVKIEYTGLRPGEKLYEELLNVKENTLPTYHSRILIAKVRSYDLEEVRQQLDNLYSLNLEGDTMHVVKKMKEVVPEFVSQNSIFEKLDS